MPPFKEAIMLTLWPWKTKSIEELSTVTKKQVLNNLLNKNGMKIILAQQTKEIESWNLRKFVSAI